MDFILPSAASQAAFLLIILAVIVVFVWGVYTSNRRENDPAVPRTLLALSLTTLLLALDSVAVATGQIAQHVIPALPLFIAVNLLLPIGFAFSPFGERLAGALPLAALVGFQAFRLPLELVLHNWVEAGTIPATMSWHGSNFDIITGILAVLLAPLANRSRPAAWGFALIGFALLLNVIRVAVLSSPLPFGWGVEPPLLLAMYLPFAWIVPVCVGGAFAGHIILFRALLTRK